MRFRKLRIVWSVFLGLACVLLIVLWVRSYSYWDAIEYSSTSHRGAVSSRGRINFYSVQYASLAAERGWSYTSDQAKPNRLRWPSGFLGFNVRKLGNGSFTFVPIWFAAMILASFAGIPWLRLRFTLRTLLIATALVAVVLGIIVGMSQAG